MRKWVGAGLPVDQLSTENALMVTRSVYRLSPFLFKKVLDNFMFCQIWFVIQCDCVLCLAVVAGRSWSTRSNKQTDGLRTLAKKIICRFLFKIIFEVTPLIRWSKWMTEELDTWEFWRTPFASARWRIDMHDGLKTHFIIVMTKYFYNDSYYFFVSLCFSKMSKR